MEYTDQQTDYAIGKLTAAQRRALTETAVYGRDGWRVKSHLASLRTLGLVKTGGSLLTDLGIAVYFRLRQKPQ